VQIYDFGPGGSRAIGALTTGTNDEVGTFQAPSDGSYKFHVNAFLSQTYDYTLKVQKV
jgi:hypothetical protein